MRHRVLHKHIWKQPAFVALNSTEKLIYLGLHNIADDEGRLEYSVERITNTLLEFEPNVRMARALDHLEEQGLIQVYFASGQTYVAITNFGSTQSIDRKLPSKIPPPTKAGV